MSPRAKPGTYDHLLPLLKPLPVSAEDASKQVRINLHKDTIVDRDARSLATGYINLRHQKDELAAALSRLQIALEAHEQLLADSQEQQAAGWGEYGVKDNAVKLHTGDTIRIQSVPYGQVKDPEAFRLWCIAAGYERQLTLHHGRMQSIVKERLLNGEPEPDGCETYAKTTVVYAKKGTE